LFANGFVINRALQAAEVLRKDGIRPVVVDVHTLQPLDGQAIGRILQETGAAVTVEDHNSIGGLGSAIAELSVEECPAAIARVGLRDTYPRSGEPDALLDYYHMGVTDIVKAARTAMQKRDRGHQA
jgi:transketolase